MNSFACPWAFLAILPLLFAAWRILRPASQRGAMTFPLLAHLPVRPSWRQRAAILSPYLFLFALFCGIVALARPRKEFARITESKNAIAIEMAIDISGSMEAPDLSRPGHPRQSRLDVVKETFRDFVQKRPDDLIGLVAFGGYATTRCPLTADHDALLDILAETDIPGRNGEVADMTEQMTAIGDGLAMACARLHSASNVASRIVILLSDGVQNYGTFTPDQAIKVAKTEKIKVYTIGIGKNTPGNSIQRFFSLGSGDPSFDDKTLKEIASQTGGRYFNVQRADGMEKTLAEIDALEKTEIENITFARYEESFAPWLLTSIVALLLSIFLASPTRGSLV